MESHKMKWVRCIRKRIAFTEGKLYPVNEDVLDIDGYPTTTDDDGDSRWICTRSGSFSSMFEEVTEDES